MSATSSVASELPKATNISQNGTRGKSLKKPRITKSKTILKRLGTSKGASINDLMEVTGWQAHSIRGFISGTVRKQMRLTVETIKDARGTSRYRIVPTEQD